MEEPNLGLNKHFKFSPDLDPKPSDESIDERFTNCYLYATLEFPGEVGREEEEKCNFVEEVRALLNKEYQSLGLEMECGAWYEQYHLFDNSGDSPVALGCGSSICDGFGVYMNRSSFANHLDKFMVILHETIHLDEYAVHEIRNNPDDPKEFKSFQKRSGYAITQGEVGQQSFLFNRFGESVVQMWMLEIVMRNFSDLSKKYGFTRDEFMGANIPYQDEVNELSGLITEMSEQKNEKFIDTWNRIKRGVITGKLMHLRDIERILGHGALRLLAGSEQSAKKPSRELIERLKVFSEKAA